MARRRANASAWPLIASLTLLAGHHCTRALHTTGIDGIQQDVAEEDGWSGINVWYLPEAIAKVTGQTPVAEWREYLTMDPFGELLSVDRNGQGKTQWWPPTTCPYGDAMQANYDQEQCIGVGEGICKNGWQLAIRQDIDNTYLMLHNADGASEIYRWFPGATQLCIGEKSPNVAYLRVDYDGGQYFLIGPKDQSDDNHAKLKIVVSEETQHAKDDVVVAFQGGSDSDTALWQIFANGISNINNEALWYPVQSSSQTDYRSGMPNARPTESPSGIPTNTPSAYFSSSAPTKSPSSEPSRMHTASPMAHPSPLPSPKPSLRAVSTDLPAISEVAGYEIELTTVKEDWIWTRDYSKCGRRLGKEDSGKEDPAAAKEKGRRWGLKKKFQDDASSTGKKDETGDDTDRGIAYTVTERKKKVDDEEMKTSKRDFDIYDGEIEVDQLKDVKTCTPKAIPVARQSTTLMTEKQKCPSKACPFGGPNVIAPLDGKIISESSGICASRINPNVIWTLNDFRNQPILYAVDSIDGSVRQYPITNGNNYDYEDIACGIGPIPHVAYIYVADIGDNLARRGTTYFFGLKKWFPVVIYRMREPNLSTLEASELTQWDKLQLEYPDGTHNAEAMMIDPVSKRIFIITKSSGTIWMTPKEWGAGHAKMTLEMVGSIKKMPNPLTAIDISPDGKEIVVKFYNSIHYFCMGSRQYDNPEDSWQDIVNVLANVDGIKVPYIEEPQGEAVCFGQSFDDGIFTLSESQGMELIPLLHYERL